MTPTKDHQLHTLLYWLAFYVVLLAGISYLAGKLTECLPVLTNLISGFLGAALAIMRTDKSGGGQ